MFKLINTTMTLFILNFYFISQAAVEVVHATSRLYFPMPQVEVVLPKNLLLRHRHVPLIQVFALLEQFSSSTTETISYHFKDKSTTPRWLHLNETNGEIFIQPTSHRIGTNVTVVIEAKTQNFGTAEMKLIIWQSNNFLQCDALTKEHCFWKNTKFQFFENQPPLEVGQLGPSYSKLICPHLNISYVLNTGQEHGMKILQDTKMRWNLESTMPHDREGNLGSNRKLNISCHTEKFGSVITSLSVEILDQDDNAPTAQDESDISHVKFNGSSNVYSPNTVDLYFKDLDLSESNNYKFQFEDELGLLVSSCREWNNTSTFFLQTFIHCEIRFNKSISIPDSSYKATLYVTDTTLLPEIAASSTKLKHIIEFITSDKSKTTEMKHILRTEIKYPSSEINISRNVAQYERIAEPLQRINETFNFTFTLLQLSNIFAVTPRTGIVYVATPNELESLSETELTVSWKLNHGKESQFTFKVKVSAEAKSCVGNLHVNKFCAEIDSSKKCTQSCGISSSNYCQWRPLKLDKPNNTSISSNYTKHYATCSPNLKTCPDGYCDELENNIYNICPQDCSKFIMGTVRKHQSLGIYRATGICTCDKLGKCTCLTERSNETKSPKSNISKLIITEAMPTVQAIVATAVCGDTCLLAVIVGPLFIFSTAMVLIVWIRRRKMLVAVRSKRSFTAQNSIQRTMHVNGDVPSSGDQNVQNANGGLEETDGHTSKLQTILATKLKPDSKYEIPRERLRIEQVLGEGEFGRVLKATARDLPGIPGRTTVAVKMLKDDAGTSELVDLLSEYELLKEVSHPNVIRLLGACTGPGGPVYIIIEFAEHGSLRSYLRRSRRLQGYTSSSGMSNSGQEEEVPPNPIAPITVRDILSFAWQISRGMSYLSDMKLVHRDLAARNVLVSSGRICKVSDFGLTRDVYEDDTYLKRSKGRVPVKWMALESLTDNIYTSKSDVWSFGIVLWELSTLGSSPYPGVAVQNLYQLLRTGYRMARPDNCSPQLYHLMRQCWEENPALRLTFKEISMQLEGMLQDGADYLDLNSTIINNRGYISDACTVPLVHDADDDTVESSNELNSDSSNKYASMQLLPLTEQASGSVQTSNDPSTSSMEFDSEAKYESPILPNNCRLTATDIPLNYLDVVDDGYNGSR